jgi:carbamoyltransferase
MYLIGISAFYHDSAAALIKNGEVISAAQEERFTRIKNDSNFPINSVKFLMRSQNLKPSDIDFVVFYEKPFLKFDRILKTFVNTAPKNMNNFESAMKQWIPKKLFQKKLLLEQLNLVMPGDWLHKIIFSDHHLSHAASAFFPSPFDRAAVVTLDGVGEWATTTIGIGNSNELNIYKDIRFPDSLGLLYAAFTSYVGFQVNSGEYKMMGLAPYGEPKYSDLIYENLIDVRNDGSFSINQEFFEYQTGNRMTNYKFHKLFGGEPRLSESTITQREMDIAASIQKVIDQVVVRLITDVARETGEKNLCLAGGVALNCVTNGKIIESGQFEKIWIQPAAGDAGGSVGAALAAYHLALKQTREVSTTLDGMAGSYLGPEFTQQEVENQLTSSGANFEVHNFDKLIIETANLLSQGNVIGWFQGRAEFGPRALGNRSILADPRSKKMQKTLNLKIKFRESFRPFAPSVLREHLEEWFDLSVDSPYMLFVSKVLKQHLISPDLGDTNLFGIDRLNIPRSVIPAVTHLDNSARIQTIHYETNSKYHSLITEFKKLTGCPVIVNTSFNIRGEPIVNTPQEAFRCFMGTDMDVLIVENCLMYKSNQSLNLLKSYLSDFVLD